MDRIINIWRENPGLVVIALVLLAVLSGQLPAKRSAGAENPLAQEPLQREEGEEIAVSMHDSECGSERNFGHIMPCGRGD